LSADLELIFVEWVLDSIEALARFDNLPLQENGFVPGAPGEGLAVRRHGYKRNPFVKDPRRGTRQGRALGTYRASSEDRSIKGGTNLATARVADSDFPIISSRSHGLPVGREGHTTNLWRRRWQSHVPGSSLVVASNLAIDKRIERRALL